jgi:hypothetical protein
MEIDIEKEGIEKSKVSFHVLKDFFKKNWFFFIFSIMLRINLKDKKKYYFNLKKTQ